MDCLSGRKGKYDGGRGLAGVGPGIHQRPSALQAIRPQIGLFGFVADQMRHGDKAESVANDGLRNALSNGDAEMIAYWRDIAEKLRSV